MTELKDLFNPAKRLMLKNVVIDMEQLDKYVLIKVGDRLMRCKVENVTQNIMYNDNNYYDSTSCYNNNLAVSGYPEYFRPTLNNYTTAYNGQITLTLFVCGDYKI